MRYVTRQQWNAMPPKKVVRISKSDGMYVHHSAGSERQTCREIQNYHMHVKGWYDIAYSWLVDRNGAIYMGRGWGVAGGHTEGYNHTSHAVCYIGNTSVSAAPAVAKASINAVIAEHNRRYGVGYVRPHNAVNSTACPGTDLTRWVNSGRPGGTSSGCREDGVRRGMSGFVVVGLQMLLNSAGQNLDVDGDFGPLTEKAVTNFNNYFKINSPACRAVATKKTLDFLEYLKNKKEGKAGTPAPAPTPAPTPTPERVSIKLGDRNYVVAGLQKMLNEVSNAGLDVDGDFGPLTKEAVQNFQRFFKMKRQDGVVDEETWAFINYLYDAKNNEPVKKVPPPVEPEPEPKPKPEPEPEPEPPVIPSTESLISRIIAVLNKILKRNNDEASEDLSEIEKDVQ
jgi:peptidoglycan hydrolase-like protein with peptidoglycan-binding domain